MPTLKPHRLHVGDEIFIKGKHLSRWIVATGHIEDRPVYAVVVGDDINGEREYYEEYQLESQDNYISS